MDVTDPQLIGRISVFDKAGRFLLPDLRARGDATYRIWVRGYGWSIRHRFGRLPGGGSIYPVFSGANATNGVYRGYRVPPPIGSFRVP